MNVNSATNAALAYASNNPKVNYNRQEATESAQGPDKDNDRDDKAVSQTQRTATTLNFSGQTIGANLSVSA